VRVVCSLVVSRGYVCIGWLGVQRVPNNIEAYTQVRGVGRGEARCKTSAVRANVMPYVER
jgi:hypothetical protein